MKFSEKLKMLRKENNLTQDELAKKLYVSRTAISKWETDMGYPSLETLKQIAEMFNTSIDSLLTNQDLQNKKLLEKGRARKYYWFSFAFYLAALVIVLLGVFFKTKYLFVPILICVVPYIIFALIFKLSNAYEKHAKIFICVRFLLISILIAVASVVTLINL